MQQQPDSYHRASGAFTTTWWNAFYSPVRRNCRYLNREGGNINHPAADQPQWFSTPSGSDPSFNLTYSAPQSTPPCSRCFSCCNHGKSSNYWRKKHNVNTRTGYNIGNDNGLVLIECSDAHKIQNIKNGTGNNIGDRNGMIEIRNGNPRKIYGIKNRTGSNLGNDNGIVKIGSFRGY